MNNDTSSLENDIYYSIKLMYSLTLHYHSLCFLLFVACDVTLFILLVILIHQCLYVLIAITLVTLTQSYFIAEPWTNGLLLESVHQMDTVPLLHPISEVVAALIHEHVRFIKHFSFCRRLCTEMKTLLGLLKDII